VRQLLEQLGRAALLDHGGAVGDEVLAQAGRPDLGALEGEGHPRVAPDVPDLELVRVEMRREQVVALDRHPDDGHVRRAVAADRGEVAEGA
jgi:hypothetical protein